MTATQAALERYSVRLRRDRIRYAIGIAVLVVAASVITSVVWLNGEISHTTLHTVATPPADIEVTAPLASQHKLWSTTDHAALGTPFSSGSVVTYDTHTVRGRDGRTGKQTWYYTRTDRTVCTAMQDNGVTVAVYKVNGNCDELTALDSGTGKREWTRTLDLDTHQLNGVPQFDISSGMVIFVSPAVIYAVNINDGYSGWLFGESGCTVQRAAPGSAGILISQVCAHRDCSELKHCLNGPQLVLRDPVAGQNTDSSKNKGNPDQITWAIPNPAGLVPASAGAAISAYAADGSSLQLFASKDGKKTATLPVHASAADLATNTDASTSDGEVLFTSGTTYAVTGIPAALQWTIASSVAPTVTGGALSLVTPLAQSTLTMAAPTGIAQLDPETGEVEQTFAVSPAPSSAAQVYPYGDGFLVEDNGVTVYQ